MYPIADDENLVLELLKQERVLLVQGSAFNMIGTQHFRIVFLPDKDQLIEAIGRLATFLERVRATTSAPQLENSANEIQA